MGAALASVVRPVFAPAVPVHQLVERQTVRRPGAVAVVYRDTLLTFAELNRRADGLADQLRAAGVGRGAVVALYMERSADAVAALLGVLKAGAAYLPIDASFPAERVAAIVADSGAALVLSDSEATSPPPGARQVAFDNRRASPPAQSDGSLQDLALVLYTSGSTGAPRGVEITHANLANNVFAWEETHRISTMRVLAQTAFFSFAVFQSDVFRALCLGLTLVICPRDVLLSPRALLQLMRREGVGFLEAVPSLMRSLLTFLHVHNGSLDFLRALVVSADRWYVREHREAQRLLSPAARLSHVYGLSETTFDSTWYDGPTEMLPPNGLVPIGRPFPNIRTYVLDDKLRPASIEGEGEIYVGGAGVARGYRSRPDLTAARFLPSPFVGGDRLFRTGDLARLLADGAIALVGRRDQQVKIRGFRVELGDVEAAVEAHPDIRQAVVEPRASASGRDQLVAYYVAQRPCDPAALRSFVAEKLPEFMVPSLFFAVPGMPLTPAGKVDRRALPDPLATAVARPVGRSEEPEAIIGRIVAETLGAAALSPTEPLRERGLDSLAMSAILVGIEDAFGIAIDSADITPELFESIATLSRHVRGDLAEALRDPPRAAISVG